MATFLGIYSKTGNVDRHKAEGVVLDFTLNNTREIITKEFPGMLLYVAKQFKEALYAAGQSLSFVSGHISFEQVKENLAGNTVKKFAHLLSSAGVTALPLFEGAFAALHYNATTHTLTFANDKFGIFPLFVFEDESCVIVSNEYQPLVQAMPLKKRTLDKDAIAEFYTLGLTLGNKTFYKHIKNLPAASYAVVTGKKLEQKKYWQPAPVENKQGPDSIAEDLFHTFTAINREYTEAQVTGLCLLSAGADSRLIISTLTDEQRKKTSFYTSNLSFLDPAEDKDAIGAMLLAKKFNLNHRVEKISFYENQFGTAYFDTERQLRASHVYGGWHGGEFLGGYCLNAAPIKQNITFKAADEKLKSVFSWWFRLKLKQHPYKTHVQEKEKFAMPGRDLLFMAEQLTRSFFTSIYGGTRAYWSQPYQLMNHGFSPFWDSRFLQKLMHIPLEVLKDYNLYNRVFKFCPKEFTGIGSNSPLTNRADSVIPKLDTGLEPKNQVPNTHHQAYTERLADKEIWRRNVYSKKLKKVLSNEFDPLTKQWLDFETWYARYVK